MCLKCPCKYYASDVGPSSRAVFRSVYVCRCHPAIQGCLHSRVLAFTKQGSLCGGRREGAKLLGEWLRTAHQCIIIAHQCTIIAHHQCITSVSSSVYHHQCIIIAHHHCSSVYHHCSQLLSAGCSPSHSQKHAHFNHTATLNGTAWLTHMCVCVCAGAATAAHWWPWGQLHRGGPGEG